MVNAPNRRTGRLARFALVVLAALTAGPACSNVRTADDAAAGPQVATAAALRTMTFNIRFGTAPDGDDAWPLRREIAFGVIRDYAPHVLGLQEALRFQIDEIRSQLPQYREIGVGRDDGLTKGEYSAILYDQRRLDTLEHGTFWLSDTPAVPGSMTWGNVYPRLVTWARFRDRASPDTFYVFNTHWDHEVQVARERSAALVLERIRQYTRDADPILLMGDFNAGEDNAAFRALIAAGSLGPARGLYDTFRAVHPQARQTGTYHAFRGSRDGAKIDAILASSHWHTLEAEIVLRNVNGRYPSDHFPVTATLALRRQDPER